MATRRTRPEPRPVYVLTLLAEGPATDVIHRLRRGLKFLLRVCRLRAISAVEIHPDPANQVAGDVFTEQSQRDDSHQCDSSLEEAATQAGVSRRTVVGDDHRT